MELNEDMWEKQQCMGKKKIIAPQFLSPDDAAAADNHHDTNTDLGCMSLKAPSC